MHINFESDVPLYLQIAEQLEDGILSGAFEEEGQAPSTTELSVTWQINPATVLKGVTMLAEQGILYKKRGVGMFVSQGAREALKQKRRQAFFDTYVVKLLEEAARLDIPREEIVKMMKES